MNEQIEMQQRQLMRCLNVHPRPVRETEYVQASVTAIESSSVVGYRRTDDGGPFTGWEIIATTDAPETAKYGYYTVRELADLRPEWLVALPLPAGWAFRFEGDTLVDCVSNRGVTHPLHTTIKLA